MFLSLYAAHNVFAGQTIELSVVEKDTLSGICEKYLDAPGQWRAVAKINKLSNPHLILPGRRVIIPVSMLKGVPMDGVVTHAQGKAFIWNDHEQAWNSLKMNQLVPEKSMIKTGPDGFTEITFKNGSSIFLKQGTEIGISSAREKGGVYYVNRLLLKAGRIITTIREATGKENHLEVETPSAVAVARGTEFRSASDDGKISRFEVLGGAVGVASMKNTVMVSTGEGTLVRKGQKPEAARKLLGPPKLLEHESIFKKMPLKLKFHEVDGAVAMRIALTRDSNLKDVVKEEVIKLPHAFEILSIPDGVYYVQATAIDKDGIEGLSTPVQIKIRANPFPPIIQTPVDNGEYGGRTLKTTWLEVRDALSYRVQIAEDKDFFQVIEEKTDIRSAGHTITLPAHGKYYFRVCSVSGDGYAGGWSDVIPFTMSPVPAAPSMDKPQVGDKELFLRWQELGKDISYRFQMARDEDFKEIVVDRKTGKPEIVVPRPTESGTYYIRIGGINQKGFQGDFSPPQTIEIRKKPYFLILGIAVGIMLLLF